MSPHRNPKPLVCTMCRNELRTRPRVNFTCRRCGRQVCQHQCEGKVVIPAADGEGPYKLATCIPCALTIQNELRQRKAQYHPKGNNE